MVSKHPGGLEDAAVARCGALERQMRQEGAREEAGSLGGLGEVLLSRLHVVEVCSGKEDLQGRKVREGPNVQDVTCTACWLLDQGKITQGPTNEGNHPIHVFRHRIQAAAQRTNWREPSPGAGYKVNATQALQCGSDQGKRMENGMTPAFQSVP